MSSQNNDRLKFKRLRVKSCLLDSLTIDSTETALRYRDLVFTQYTGWGNDWKYEDREDLTLDQVVDICVQHDLWETEERTRVKAQTVADALMKIKSTGALGEGSFEKVIRRDCTLFPKPLDATIGVIALYPSEEGSADDYLLYDPQKTTLDENYWPQHGQLPTTVHALFHDLSSDLQICKFQKIEIRDQDGVVSHFHFQWDQEAGRPYVVVSDDKQGVLCRISFKR